MIKEGINLPEGEHTIKVQVVQGEFDFSKMISHTFDEYKNLPGKIAAVYYITGGEDIAYHDRTPENIGGEFRNGSVDIRTHPDGTYNIGWNQPGEWYKYNVNISEIDTFTMDMLVTTDIESSQVKLWLDGEIDLTGVIDVPVISMLGN